MGHAQIIESRLEKEQNRYIFLGLYTADDYTSSVTGDFVFIHWLDNEGVNGVIKGTAHFEEYWMKEMDPSRQQEVKQQINASVKDYLRENRLKFMLEGYNVGLRLGEN
ncbi:hypothetical protein ACFVHQ_13670 [Actinomycetes bacterium NPDC127524]